MPLLTTRLTQVRINGDMGSWWKLCAKKNQLEPLLESAQSLRSDWHLYVLDIPPLDKFH